MKAENPEISLKTNREKRLNAFIKSFEKLVQKTIQKYELVNKKDKILVACSGGKDSSTALYLLKKFGYNVEALHINLLMGKWSKKNLQNIKKFCKRHRIKLHSYSIRDEIGYGICYIKSVAQQKANLKQCTVCGILRRWLINKKARELGATKVATGHNLDDEAQTIVMNWMKGNPWLSLNLGPITGTIQDKKFVTRVKPLYFCKESDVKRYSEIMNFPVLYQRCPCVFGAMRHEVRNMLDGLEKMNKNIKLNIVNNFLTLLPKLRAGILAHKLRYCSLCGEPSRREVCKACQIMAKLPENAKQN